MRYLELCTIDHAKEVVRTLLNELSTEEVSLFELPGRMLAEDIVSNVDVPPFDRSRMDGYAVRAKDTYEAEEDKPVALEIIDKIRAGGNSDLEIASGQCMEIATGAPLPKGADAVVMVEFAEINGNSVKLYKAVSPHENIQPCGNDIMVGELIMRKNTVISPRDIGAISAVGKNKLKVFKNPSIGLLSTGNELINPDEKLEPYKIYDVNTYTIASSILEKGWNFNFYGIVRDNKEDLMEKLKKAMNEDVILLSGGTSAGVGDLTSTAIEELGGEILVHGIKIKPGKPTIIGRIGKKLVVGLPGYPTSCLTIFDVLFNEKGKTMRAQVYNRYMSAKGREEYLPVSIIRGKDGYGAYPVLKGSEAITSLTYADGYIIIPENKEIVEDEIFDVHMFGDIRIGLNIIGSHCVGIDRILRKGQILARTVNTGSLGGIMAVKRKEADIAGIHLLDNNGEYNISYLKKYNVSDAVLVRGYIREQGFMFKKELGIKSIDDLIEKIRDYRIINRNKGSGTRILFDKFLKENNVDKNSLNGYDIEAKTHSAVGAAVSMGKAQIGLGISTISDHYNLEFIPIADEYYDLLIPKEKLYDEDIIKFIETLKKEELPFKKSKDAGKIIYEC
ncbi:molybdopterin biosynthesis protein [Methanococcus maripaludis]|uniref:Putative molybdopterin biosynthesis protein n=1 Tax=Methanococcus maripaludis TaxID=39152 RepID=A0A7J9PGV3_METMI|nr:molybdopterin biosynthesis protein [Methanococcus maripaludis]MBA2860739.1 putative molybdopterin biosynthesis protein [Methanococcus maripaludis]